MLAKMYPMETPSHPKYLPQTCPRCGEAFTCMNSAHCGCMEVELLSETLERISEKYQDCLCPKCLQEIAEGAQV